MALSRRDLIKAGVFAGAAVSFPLSRVVSGQSALTNRMPASKLPKPFDTPFTIPPVAIPMRQDPGPKGTDYYQITMKEIGIQIFEGLPKTKFFAYVDHMSKGDAGVPGPTIHANRDRPVVVRFRNDLPKEHPTLRYVPWTSVHLHGSASLPQFDGYANDITLPGQFKDYHYPNSQDARTLWYHDHGVHHTAENVYHGLLAQYHLHDALEESLKLPQGQYDVPLILGDALFNQDGSLLFTLEDQSGLWGDVILVNGKPWPVMKVEQRKYRFRTLGAAASRSWRLSLDSGGPMTIIATDGGLMPSPQNVDSFRTSSGERYDVIIDFADYEIGERVILQNKSPKNNRNFANTDKIMAFDVVGKASDTSNNSIPDALHPDNPLMALEAKHAVRTRKMRFHRKHGEWVVNGATWQDVVDSEVDGKFELLAANPQVGETEIWELENSGGGWNHPAHLHLTDFKILDRNGKPPFASELGPKDVVYLGENEKVRVIIEWEGRGKYMIHCHNAIHEDHDMMVQYEVSDPNQGALDVTDPTMVATDPLDKRTRAQPFADEGSFPP
jgi:FtsP/CotA-like multicopper oxidase with cupredoxin domain